MTEAEKDNKFFGNEFIPESGIPMPFPKTSIQCVDFLTKVGYPQFSKKMVNIIDIVWKIVQYVEYKESIQK